MSEELIEYEKNGDLRGIQKCIENGADINFQNKNGATVLRLAKKKKY